MGPREGEREEERDGCCDGCCCSTSLPTLGALQTHRTRLCVFYRPLEGKGGSRFQNQKAGLDVGVDVGSFLMKKVIKKSWKLYISTHYTKMMLERLMDERPRCV